jgi:hypothetical protein
VDKQFQNQLESLFAVWGGIVTVFAFLVIIPLTLWSAWANHSPLVFTILDTLLCLSFGWALISNFILFRRLRKLGLSGKGRLRLLSGPRPDDPDELKAWQAGWHFMFAILAVIFSIIALPVASWLSGQ